MRMCISATVTMLPHNPLTLPLSARPLHPVFPPKGKKAVPKVYICAVSPLRPNLVAVGANSGMAFMTFDRMYPLPVAAMPLRNLAAAHVLPNRMGMAEPAHAAYVAHMGDSVWHVIATAVQQVGVRERAGVCTLQVRGLRGVASRLGEACSAPRRHRHLCTPTPPDPPACLPQEVSGCTLLVPTVIGRERIGAANGQTGRALLGVSARGDFVSCCWPATRTYVIWYRCGT